jgi:hypothetical protein
MVLRPFWLNLIEDVWKGRPVLWLWGVPDLGKTELARSLPHSEYFDCALPEVQARLKEPGLFFIGLQGRRAVLDHIHRLEDPPRFLGGVMELFPSCKIVAVAPLPYPSAVKQADPLAGKRASLHLGPLTLTDLEGFGTTHLETRLLHGGLPRSFAADGITERFRAEWMEKLWDTGLARRFHIRRRSGFSTLLNYLWSSSPEPLDSAAAARACGLSRETVAKYMRAMSDAGLLFPLKPYATRRPTELMERLRPYAFDTGFVVRARGWARPGPEEYGLLWKHFVLNELLARSQGRGLHYWRDRRGHEVDFVLARKRAEPAAILCAWPSQAFDPAPLKAFRRQYPKGPSWVVCPDILLPVHRAFGRTDATMTNLEGLIKELEG